MERMKGRGARGLDWGWRRQRMNINSEVDDKKSDNRKYSFKEITIVIVNANWSETR